MPTYTRSELLAIRESMSNKPNSSQLNQQCQEMPEHLAGEELSGVEEVLNPIQALWKKTNEIQQHVEDIYSKIDQSQLQGGGKEERALKVFRHARNTLANFYHQLQEQISSITMMGMPAQHSQKQMLNDDSCLEVIANLKKQAKDHCQQVKQLKKLLKVQMKVMDKRFVEIDRAIEQLKIDYENIESSTLNEDL